MPAEIDVLSYLASKGVQTHATGNGREVVIHCWACPDGDPKGKGRMYVNTEEAFFQCKRCGEAGGSTLLMRAFGDEPSKKLALLPGQDPAKRRQILEEATALAETMLANNDDIMLYLCNDRGLWPETVLAYRFGAVVEGWSLVGGLGAHHVDDLKTTGLVYRDGPRQGKDFFYNHLLIPYRSRGTTVQLRGRTLDPHASGGKYMTGPGEEVRLFNADDVDDAEDIFICEGELDCLVVKQALSLSPEDRVRKVAVVGIAGANALPANFVSYFANAKRVYIALDPDETGRKGSIKIKELLGARARVVEWPIGVVEEGLSKYGVAKMDWSEFVNACGKTWRDIVSMMGTAAGKRLYTMRESGAQSRTAKSKDPGIKTGYAQLDATILPGIVPGQVVIILAKTGCLQGDAEIAVNRGGKGFRIKIKDLVDRWEGTKDAWGRSAVTYVQREVDGQLHFGELINAWCSGVKATYTVTTVTGRTIRATDEHPFLTERGWLRLDELVKGDLVHVRGKEINVAHERVMSVEKYGEEITYDLEVADDPHNFLANGFVVHNTGKTILLCNLAVAMRNNRVLFISLEMTREEVYDRLKRIYLFHYPQATDEELEDDMSNVLICDENRLSDQDMEMLIGEYESETGHKPEAIYVDYLGYYARGQKGSSPYEKTTSAVMQLKAIAKANRCIVITPHQVNRMAKEGRPIDMDDARDSGAVSETADVLLSIYRPDDALASEGGGQQSGRVKMTLLKSRHGGKDRTFTFVMDLLTLAIVEDIGPNAQRAAEHNHMLWRGDNYDRLRQLETAPRQLTLVGEGSA